MVAKFVDKGAVTAVVGVEKKSGCEELLVCIRSGVGIGGCIREPKSMNLEIISKAFLQMPLKKFACLVKFFIRNLHTFFLVVTKFSLVSSNFSLRKIKSFLDM